MPTKPYTCRRPFTRILLATDFSAASAAAFSVALQLCRDGEASLFLLNVFEYGTISPPEIGGQMIELDRFYEEANESMHSLVQDAQQAGVTCEGAVVIGLAAAEILAAIPQRKADLVVVGTRAWHGMERLVFGSTAEGILRKASCPVLTVGPLASARPSSMETGKGIILFATDFNASTTEALGYAATCAATMKLPLHCLNVLPRGMDDETHKGVIPLMITSALEHLAVTFDHELDFPVCAVACGGEIATAVAEYARKHDARMIVLGVRRASFVASHLPAHIAYRVITEAPCPVLTIAYPPVVELSEPACPDALALCEADQTLPSLIQ